MKTASEKPIELDFVDQPLVDTMGYLTERTGVTFSLQRQALEISAIPSDQPVTIRTSDVPLRAALQAFEDAFPELQFVVRDYGALLTTRDYAQEHGYVPVLELGKEPASTFKSR